MPTDNEDYPLIELRHFYMGDLKFAIFDKTCGPGLQREQYQKERMLMFFQMREIFLSGSAREYIAKLDLIPVLRDFLFNLDQV